MSGLLLPFLQSLLVLKLLTWSPVHGFAAGDVPWMVFLGTVWLFLGFRETLRGVVGGIFVPLLLWPLWAIFSSWSWALSDMVHRVASFFLDLVGSPFGTSTSDFRIDGVTVTADPMKTAVLALSLLLVFRIGQTLLRSGLRSSVHDLVLLAPILFGFAVLRWTLVAPLLVHVAPDLVAWGPALFHGPVLALSLAPLLLLPCPVHPPSERTGNGPFTAWALVMVVLFVGQALPLLQGPSHPHILIDDSHSSWEPVLPPPSILEHPLLAENNYRPLLHRLLPIASVTVSIAPGATGFDRPPGLEIASWKTLMADPVLLQKYQFIILKCPTRAYSNHDQQKIFEWVDQGGKLVLIGEHTDVFFINTHLNGVLASAGIRFAADVICDGRGRWLTTFGPLHAPFPWAPGNGWYSWTSGASLEGPSDLLPLMVSSPDAFSDPAEATNPHFFGNLSPVPATRFGPFTLAAALPCGRGTIFCHGDSTGFNAAMISTPGKTAFLEHLVRYSGFPVPGAAVSLAIFLFTGILGCQALGCLLRARSFSLAGIAILLQALLAANLPVSLASAPSAPETGILLERSLEPAIGLNSGDQTRVCAADSLTPLIVAFENLGFPCHTSFDSLDRSLAGKPALLLLAEPAAYPSIRALRALQKYLRQGGLCLMVCRRGLSGVSRSLALGLGLREIPGICPETGLPSITAPGAATSLIGPGTGLSHFPVGSGHLFFLEHLGDRLPVPSLPVAHLLVDLLVRR